MKDIFHIVNVGHGFFIAVRVHSLDRDLPFAHWESILLLSLDDILDSDDLSYQWCSRPGVVRSRLIKGASGRVATN